MFGKNPEKPTNIWLKLSKYAFYFLLVLFIASVVKNLAKIREVKERITEKENEIAKLEKESKDLEEKLKQVQSDDYVEKQIRDKLGLAKEGEIVVVLPDEAYLRSLSPKIEEEKDSLPDPNWKRWMKLFGL